MVALQFSGILNCSSFSFSFLSGICTANLFTAIFARLSSTGGPVVSSTFSSASDAIMSSMSSCHSENSASRSSVRCNSENSASRSSVRCHSENSASRSSVRCHSENSASRSSVRCHSENSARRSRVRCHSENSARRSSLSRQRKNSEDVQVSAATVKTAVKTFKFELPVKTVQDVKMSAATVKSLKTFKCPLLQ